MERCQQMPWMKQPMGLWHSSQVTGVPWPIWCHWRLLYQETWCGSCVGMCDCCRLLCFASVVPFPNLVTQLKGSIWVLFQLQSVLQVCHEVAWRASPWMVALFLELQYECTLCRIDPCSSSINIPSRKNSSWTRCQLKSLLYRASAYSASVMFDSLDDCRASTSIFTIKLSMA